MLDGLQEIFFTLRQNKLRTLLTAFGVFWGIFMLILLLGAGRGMQNGVMEDFGNEPLDIIVLNSGETSVAYRGMGLGRKIKLDEADVQAITQQVSGVRIISGDRTQYGVTVDYGRKNSNAHMHGIPDAFFVLKNEIPFTFGRRTNPLDVDQTRKVVALGTNVVERLFDKGVDPVGKDVRVKDVRRLLLDGHARFVTGLVEQAELDRLRVRREQREVRTVHVPRRAERARRPRKHLHLRLRIQNREQSAERQEGPVRTCVELVRKFRKRLFNQVDVEKERELRPRLR